MLPRFSNLLRHTHSIMPRAITCLHQLHSYSVFNNNAAGVPFCNSPRRVSFSLFNRSVKNHQPQPFRGVRASGGGGQREYRKVRNRKPKRKNKELEFCVPICIEESLPDDPEILNIAEMLRLNVPMAMKLAFDGLKGSEYKTRDPSIKDVGGFESVELSVLLCNDEFIRSRNKEWRDEDHATDVLSLSYHVAEADLPILSFGDIIISIETAARQAEERGHTLLDEIRILMVHGLLHLLGFDHELSEEAEVEMEKEEELLLRSLGWKGKGLIKSAYDDAETNSKSSQKSSDVTIISTKSMSANNLIEELSKDRKKEGSLRFYKPKFNYIFCDMDGTLLNSKSQISTSTAKALREASARGVKIVIATGKARPAVIDIFKMVDLAGKDGIVSEFSPGVFLQMVEQLSFKNYGVSNITHSEDI
ncbi:hypothetical protein TSUD_10830 [Trifolium subterraneum]|nr:hypothetical protein TSUD_10830 [Trifolium subterraneum]